MLRESGWDRKAAASRLGISRASLTRFTATMLPARSWPSRTSSTPGPRRCGRAAPAAGARTTGWNFSSATKAAARVLSAERVAEFNSTRPPSCPESRPW
ncbi:hypothetical protein HUW62_35200 [Myxococcus sp. AM011]|uniref:helix-turn-helix domain-containing protein n=1 Tax=Myxococcus sp. AM011 TaxID=2745200 RepID=UPI001595C773|nr:hypothetical protein [Myxococcus sp. AM011]